MIGMLLAIACTAVVLFAGEYLWRKRILKGEYARKFVHINAATIAAFWPLIMTRLQIVILSVLCMVVLVAVKQLNIFRSLRGVRRSTYGELWYAIGIGLSAVVFKENAIYTIAILHMALADGFAAIVGVGMGKKAKNFTYNGARKSIEGTLTFVVVSFFLNATYWLYFSGHQSQLSGVSPLIIPLYSIVCAMTLSVAEVVAPRGSDNVIIPMLAGALLWVPYAALSFFAII